MPTSNYRAGSIKYFGELSWANFLNWIITLGLGMVLTLVTINLGGVRPETQITLQGLLAFLVILHGLCLAVSRRKSRRLNPIPFFFIPFLIWALASVLFWTPTPWRGSYEIGYFLSAFIFGWVTVNHVRTRAQLRTLVTLALFPLAISLFAGFYQFFQEPSFTMDPWLDYPVNLNPRYLGHATGVFADPGSFAALMLIFLPFFAVAAYVRRLPVILRIFAAYAVIILIAGITLTQTYWAVVSVILIMAVVPWFCFRRKKRRQLFSILGIGSALTVFTLMYLFNPLFERGFAIALTPQSEGVRLVFWKEVLSDLIKNPILGSGAGSFSLSIEQSAGTGLPNLPLTPHNDFLLILHGYGLVGGCLLILPLAYAFYRGFRLWSEEPFRSNNVYGAIMPGKKFYLSMALSAMFAYALCAFFHFPVYVPVLSLYGALITAIVVKLSFDRSIRLPAFRYSGVLYFLVCICAGASFWVHTSFASRSHGLELRARERLEAVVERQLVLTGDGELVDSVIELYDDALIAQPGNGDAWIGLSMAVCQLYYRDPSEFKEDGARAVKAAARAYEICPEYWLASAQLGVAYALSGQIENARAAFLRSIGLAPNSSNAHYYYAAFLAGEDSMRDEAIEQVRRALEINPNHAAARRLEQKLLIL